MEHGKSGVEGGKRTPVREENFISACSNKELFSLCKSHPLMTYLVGPKKGPGKEEERKEQG